MSVATPTLERPADVAAELWGFPEVAGIFGVKLTTIQRWVRLGQLPKPMRFGKRPVWSADTIRDIVRVGAPR